MSVFFIAALTSALAQDAVPPAEVVAPDVEEAAPQAAEAEKTPAPRVVQESWASFVVDDPIRQVDALTEKVLDVGGAIRSSSRSLDREYGDSAAVVVEVPLAVWPSVESALKFDGSASIEHDKIARAEQEGTGAPVVVLSVDYASPHSRVPNVLIGATGGLSMPADTTGLGLAQLVGVRVMDPDREGSIEVLYAPSNAPFVDVPEPWLLQITGGGTVYSDYLGAGERRLLNPYLGARLGYAYRGESWFMLQGELGVELVHLGHVIWDVHARPTGAFRKGAVGLSLETGTGLVVPF